MSGISLDCLTLPDVSPVDLFAIAAGAGYASASLWVQEPVIHPQMIARPAMAADIRRAIADTGVTAGNLEVFNLNIDDPIAVYEPALTFGAELGAVSATAINYGPARHDIAEKLADFHELCARLGLHVYIEPISMGATRTLADGVALIEAAGVDAQLVMDMLHLIRTGGDAETVAAIAPRHIGYVQLCDGPLAIEPAEIGPESVASRLYPGEGEFPLVSILKALPMHAQLGVETPNLARLQNGATPLERARQALEAAQRVLTAAGVVR
ncbi:MAG: TIM barrel protein [Novosphingobium sp.]